MGLLTRKLLLLSLCFCCVITQSFAQEIDYNQMILDHSKQMLGNNQDNMNKVAKSIVSIEGRSFVAAYEDCGKWSGTGFVVNAEKGFIATNSHVVGSACVGEYFVTFSNGRQIPAKVLYNDPHVDFAVLKIDPSQMPKDAIAIELADETPKMGEELFIVGNNECAGFSRHQGHLSDMYSIDGLMPQDSYVISINSVGGSSGSPLLNKDNKAVAILYGGGDTYATGLKGQYLKHILDSLNRGEEPARKHIGVVTVLKSIDELAKHYHFSEAKIQAYLDQFPDSRNKVICVKNVIKGTNSAGKLQVGDVLWEINGKKIGPDLAFFDLEMSKSLKNEVDLTIIRKGKEIKINVDLYDLHDHVIDEIVEFAGAFFFEADDYCAEKYGVKVGDVLLLKANPGSAMAYAAYRSKIEDFADHKISSLKDIKEAVKYIQDHNIKYTYIQFVNTQPYNIYNNFYVTHPEDKIGFITISDVDNHGRVLECEQGENFDGMFWSTHDL